MSTIPKALYVAKKLREQFVASGNAKNVYDAVKGEKERSKRKHAEFVEFCAKLAMAVPKPGQVMTPRHVGSFTGKATTNFLKPPGNVTNGVTNHRLSLRSAMTKSMRV